MYCAFSWHWTNQQCDKKKTFSFKEKRQRQFCFLCKTNVIRSKFGKYVFISEYLKGNELVAMQMLLYDFIINSNVQRTFVNIAEIFILRKYLFTLSNFECKKQIETDFIASNSSKKSALKCSCWKIENVTCKFLSFFQNLSTIMMVIQMRWATVFMVIVFTLFTSSYFQSHARKKLEGEMLH